MPAKLKPAESDPTAPQFPGFRPAAFAFFRDLTVQNDKDWFQANKSAYEVEVQRPMAVLVADLVAEFARRGVPLTGDAKKSVFRIHRDVRFSNDKSPYKTHAGAALTRDGGKMSPGVVYFHLDPEGSFVAAGFYSPEPPVLAKLRAAVVRKPNEFLGVVGGLVEVELPLSREDALKRTPRGFEASAGGPVAEYLKLKSLVVSRALTPKDLLSPVLVATVAKFAVAALPLLNFGWAAIDAAD